jgi:hypothetical protein
MCKGVKEKEEHITLIKNGEETVWDKKLNVLSMLDQIHSFYVPDTVPELSDQTQCAICIEPFAGDKIGKIIKLNCGHKFHIKCIQEYITKTEKTDCPLCRGDINEMYNVVKFGKVKKSVKPLLQKIKEVSRDIDFLHRIH